jgi:hypothetical protein
VKESRIIGIIKQGAGNTGKGIRFKYPVHGIEDAVAAHKGTRNIGGRIDINDIAKCIEIIPVDF